MKQNRKKAMLYGGIALALLLFVVILASTSGSVTIADILDNPRHYSGRRVSVSGEVTRVYSLLGYGGYEIKDGAATMPVVSDQANVRVGQTVVVRGVVQDLYRATIGSESPGGGMVIIESRRPE